jgi:DNA-binding transcriptional MerR regulator
VGQSPRTIGCMATTQASTRRSLDTLPAAVRWIFEGLGLEADTRYDLAALRVSAKGRLDKLEDQEGTGIGVFKDNGDFQALAGMGSVTERGWLPVRYRDVGGTKPSVFAWVGVVGRTIFVAAADSAAEANIPPHPDDISGVGRNAYVELFMAAARAGHVLNILLPFLSRIWRNDLWAEILMATINRHLPACSVWVGSDKIATYGSDKLLTSVKGREAAGYAEVLREQVFEKGITHLKTGGQWDRREDELPLGLRRKRITQPDGLVRKSREVEETEWRAVVIEAMKLRASGASWAQVGALLAKRAVPMSGTKGSGRTFAEYSSEPGRTAGARTLFDEKALDYYRTGEWNETRTINSPELNVRGVELERDLESGRGKATIRVNGMPWQQFLTDAEWEAFDKVEATEARKRTEGGASHKRRDGDLVSPFQGVSSWLDGGREHTFAPETSTAYRWRTREPQDRGWNNQEGDLEATLRRDLFHTAFAGALLDQLRDMEHLLAPITVRRDDTDPLHELEAGVAGIEAAVISAERASERADRELLLAEVDEESDEIEHWRAKGKTGRAALRRLRAELVAAKAALAAGAKQVIETVEVTEADVAEAVLVASLLLDGPKKAEPIVRYTLTAYGVLTTLHLTRDGAAAGMVRATAAALLPMLDGSQHEIEVTWEVPDTHAQPGDTALVPAIVRAWAVGESPDAIAGRYPGHDADRIRKRISQALRRGGVRDRARRTAALKCPVSATRTIIAAAALDDSALAAPYLPEFRAQVTSAYFGEDMPIHKAKWSDGSMTREVRRVLTALDHDVDGMGVNVEQLARSCGVKKETVRLLARRYGLVEKVGPLGVRAKRCSQSDCRGLLTLYLPAPETGSGLICRRCWHAEGLDAQLPAEYAEPWVVSDGTYVVDVLSAVSPTKPSRDRLLTTTEAAKVLGITPWCLRDLDRTDDLLPTERTGVNGGRLYSLALLELVSEERRTAWRQRAVGGQNDDGLLDASDVAAVLGCAVPLVRKFAEAGALPVAATTAGGHRRYRREDVDAVDRAGIHAYDLTPIAEAAQAMGMPENTLRKLSNAGLVPFELTTLRQRRYDIGPLREALRRLDLDATPDNPLVAIGDLATHPEVALSTRQLRRFTDEGLVRCAGRIGGKRRYRLADAVDSIRTARACGQIPPAP